MKKLLDALLGRPWGPRVLAISKPSRREQIARFLIGG
jgi:hypothetical protein